MNFSSLLSKIKKIDWQKVLPILFSVGATGFGALTSLLIARPLGNELYGQIQYFVGIIGVLTTTLQFGINFILVKNSQFEKDKKAFFTKHLLLFNLLNAVGMCIFILVAYFLLNSFSSNVLLILIVFFSGYSAALDGLVGAFLLGTGKAAASTFLGSFLPKAILLVLAVVALNTLGNEKLVDLYVPIYLLAYGVSALPYSVLLIRKTTFRFEKKELAAVFSFFLITITQSLNSYLSRVMQGEYDLAQNAAGLESYNGIYGLSLQIFSLSTLFSSVITTLAQPIFSHFYSASDTKQLINEYRKVLRVNSYVGTPFCMALIVESKKVLEVFGSSYVGEEAEIFFLLVGLQTLISHLAGPDGTLLTYAGHQKIQVLNGFINISTFFLFSLILLHFTIYGIPIAFLASSFFSEVAKFIEFKKFYGCLPIDAKSFLTIFVCIALSVAVFLPLSFIGNIYIWAILNVIVGVAFILLSFALTPFKSDKTFFKSESNGTQK